LNPNLKSRLFWFGLAFKLALIPWFGSSHLRDLFIPFIDKAVTDLGTNPWSVMPPSYFPYGSILFLILWIPKFLAYTIFGNVALGQTALSLTLMKLPLLVADYWILRTLQKFIPYHSNKLLWFYWLNPVAIYISYVHAQLDVVCVAFGLASLLALIHNRVMFSSMLMAAATLCKFQVIATYPFVLAYIWNRNFVKEAGIKIFQWTAPLVAIIGVGFLPLLNANKLGYVTFQSPEALRVFSPNLDYGSGQILYVGLILSLLTIGRLCFSSRITEQGLVLGSGIIYGSLLVFTRTSPGWYYWVLPYLALFFCLYRTMTSLLYWMFSIFFLAYFAVFHLNGFPEIFSGISFTLLQTSFLACLVGMWLLAVAKENSLLGRNRPVFIGLAGDSGAGKNHLSQILQELFNAGRSVILEGDDYHKWERGHAKWQEITHLNPQANYLLTMAQHTKLLSQGMTVVKKSYDHQTGNFTDSKVFKPSQVVIMQGLHTFYLRGMRQKLDLKIFLEPHEQVRLYWKLKRDVEERGHSQEKVLEAFDQRKADGRAHISPQKVFADCIVEYAPEKELTQEELLKGEKFNAVLKCTFWNDEVLDDLMTALESKGCKISYTTTDTIDRVCYTLLGSLSAEQIEGLSKELFPSIRSITRGRIAPSWLGGYDGILQLMTLGLLRNRMTAETV